MAAVVWEPEASARGFVGNGHGAKAALAWAAACAHLLAHLCRVARSLEPILDAVGVRGAWGWHQWLWPLTTLKVGLANVNNPKKKPQKPSTINRPGT